MLDTSKQLQGLSGLTDRLEILLESNVFDERECSLIRLRYGVGLDKPLAPSEIAKIMKVKAKALEGLIEQVDRKIFNSLKNAL